MLPSLLLALSLAATPPPPLDAQREAVARDLLHLAARLQHEIEAGDAAALLARVPPEGLRCGGQLVPRARVKHDLETEGAWLHGALFGSPGAADPPGRPSSLRAFFAQAREVAALVAFRANPRSELGLPCLEFKARDAPTPGAPFCFEKRAGRWWFTDSLYPC